MAVNTTSVLSNNIQTAYSQKVELDFQSKKAFAQFGETKKWARTDKDPFPSNSVKFMIYGNLAPYTTELSETTDPTSKSLTNSFATVTLTEHGDLVSTTKKLELSSFTSLDAVSKLVSNSMVESVDLIARVAYEAQTGADYVTYMGQTSKAAITSANTLTPAQIEKTSATLLGNRVPGYDKTAGAYEMLNKSNYYVGLIHPHVLYDLRAVASNGWRTPQEYVTPDNLYNFEEGMWGGVRFVVTDLAMIDYDAGAGDATTISGAHAAADTTIDVVDATGFSGTFTVTEASADYTYKIVSVSANEVTIGTCIAKDDEPYYTETAGLVTALLGGEAVKSGVDVYTTYIFGFQAIGYAEGEGPHATITKPSGGLERQMDFGWFGFFGYGEIRAKAMHKIFSASALGTN